MPLATLRLKVSELPYNFTLGDAEPPTKLPLAQEPSRDERELLQGYRGASPEVREIMRVAARNAIRNSSPRPDGSI